jgi:hypothetical protein
MQEFDRYRLCLVKNAESIAICFWESTCTLVAVGIVAFGMSWVPDEFSTGAEQQLVGSVEACRSTEMTFLFGCDLATYRPVLLSW